MEPREVTRAGILQVHPTRLCNLECAHCYSSSSPTLRDGLPADLLVRAIEDAVGLGFRTVSFSGGEPLVYDALPDVVEAARRLGCTVNLVSNGILIGSQRFERVAGGLTVVALSLDGLPPRHNAIRRSEKSFGQVERAAARLRERGQRFGLIHTLTSESLDEIEALAALAVEWGASLLQLHPFEPSGRGVGAPGMTPLSADERLVAYLLAAALEEFHPGLRVQLDLVHRDVARHAPAAIHGAPLAEASTPLELVVQADGRVVPLTYGIDDRWAVADLARERLADAWPRFLAGPWPELRRHLRGAAIGVARGKWGEVAAWHSAIRETTAAHHLFQPRAHERPTAGPVRLFFAGPSQGLLTPLRGTATTRASSGSRAGSRRAALAGVHRSNVGVLLAGLLLLSSPGAAEAAPVLSIQPGATNVFQGDEFLLDVMVAGAEDLFAFDIEVSFDAAIIRALDIIPGAFLGSIVGVEVDDLTTFIDNPGGSASGAQSRLVIPGVSGDGRLFSLRFRARAPGSTNVDFDVDCDVTDPFCTELRNSFDEPLMYGTESGIVNVARRAIPEPGAAGLLAAGLLAVVRRRHRP